MEIEHQSQYIALRQKYPEFTFEDYKVEYEADAFSVTYFFRLGDTLTFCPSVKFIPPKAKYHNKLAEAQISSFAFHIGMIELISYWKAACSPKVIVKPYHLTPDMIKWWKKLYFNGLGEFFYLNRIDATIGNFMELEGTGGVLSGIDEFDFVQKRVLVPVGGGKDSVVTLELLKAGDFDVVPFIVNPREASLNCVLKAGFSEQDLFRVQRTIDPQLLQLNHEGFLNGHTPFSALLAFVSLPSAVMCGAGHIALSNESSANESTVLGSDINHQYSKTIDFENDFRFYLNRYINKTLNYFSFLRPLNELQIAQRFSRLTQHHEVFRSCNVGSKSDSWCGHCPKCLFTAIMLAPFIGVEKVHHLFSSDLLNDNSLLPILEDLTGHTPVKPFECVGTVDEVSAALLKIAGNGEWPALVLSYINKEQIAPSETDFLRLLNEVNPVHNLHPEFLNLISRSI
ncbi:MAG: hypothetical protein A2X11_02230 [Bacteroidetes bacterium GWE2_42_24]|nr:MAG: hypothetical protein A2X11_02230 [Bacteroidetes bacterium GWE2_42_24]